MKTIFLLIIILYITSINSQPCGYYDKQTNTFHNGFSNSGFVNLKGCLWHNNPLPPLFNWQIVYADVVFFIADIYFIDSLYGWATDANGGFLKTTDSGFNWSRVQIVNGSGCLCGVHFLNRDTGWVCGINKLIRKTTNNGAVWTIQDTMESFNRSVYFMNYNTGFITGTIYPGGEYGFIMKTTNSGLNWEQIYVHSLSQSEIYEQFWLNEDTGWFCGSNLLLKTTNGGINFINFYSNLPPTSNGSNGLLGIYFINGQTGWISAGNLDHKNMYKTTNSGINWVFQDNPIVPYQFSQLNDVTFINEDTGWAAALVGQIIVTTNGGTNWLTDLNSPVEFLCFSNYVSTKLWCGAGGGEIWYLDNLPPNGIQQISNNIPGKFSLKQNYPNPFNNQTIIEFEIPKREFINLKIYDIMGKEIEKLAERIFEVGVYKISYEAERLSSGVYLYALETENYKEAKRFILIK